MSDYKKRFFELPPDLQALSPKPDFQATNAAENAPRIPKLAVRGKSDTDSPMSISVTPSPTISQSMNEKAGSIGSSEDVTLPPSPNENPGAIAPWEEEKRRAHKYEARSPVADPMRRPSAVPDESFTTATNDRHSSEMARQPFRHEVIFQHKQRN